ncbi:calcium-binding and coiled-coil domain-containing protein 1-like isoform X2 [Anguilla anguilla]|uniref:calcium-binding and coiled-coil domain-containing protein 1-like isoform X2 n=1 Tax=Anguilla anguilla TaxID=7936 RepID=UPI0015ABE811|nr:calcium-binding and coiled-coil domain-containing protein 1-like isoform X2 [Anguilla anguilla]
MEKLWKVEFRNVGRSYFPQSRVECHYSFSAQHSWASCDWIGLFKVGWSSLRDYHTFVWALAPANYTEGSNVNCCVHFQASYLPRPGPAEYQFVYVDGAGEVCARSAPFSFCAPKPLDDLVTLEQGQHGDGDEECEDILLVVPRAELLQSRLEECLRERAALLQAREAEERKMKREQETREGAEEVWQRARVELESQVVDLKEKLRQNKEETESLEEKLQNGHSSLEAVTAERDGLLAERAQSQQRIRELEDDIKALRQRGLETDGELEKMKERVKKMSMQRRDEEEEKKSLQMETEAALGELRCARERLDAGERTVEGLRAELSDMAAQRDRGQAELHQARLQAAQLTLQLADAGLALREGRASWAQDREALRHNAEMDRERVQKLSREVQRKEEWLQEERMEREKVEAELGKERDCNRVQLGEVRRELHELRASLYEVHREKDRNLLEKQDLMGYIRQLEQRLEAVADAKWSEAALNASSRPSSPSGSSEDENPEALQAPRPAGQLVTYSLCSPPEQEALLFPMAASPPRDPPRGQVVISQPAPVSSPRQPEDDTLTHSSESEGEEQEAGQSGSQSSEEETALLLPDHKGTIFSELADSPMW